MTRPGHVLCEFPVAEAEGLLARLAPDPKPSLSAALCDAAELGRQRIEQSVRVERQPGGTCHGTHLAPVPTPEPEPTAA